MVSLVAPQVLTDAQRLQRWRRTGHEYVGFTRLIEQRFGVTVSRTSLMRAVTGRTRKPARVIALAVAEALELPVAEVFRHWKA